MVIGRSAWPFRCRWSARRAGGASTPRPGWRRSPTGGSAATSWRRSRSCCAYVEAQRVYASADRDDDGVLEYAQHLASTGDQRDGLYWPTAAGDEPSPFGPFLARSTTISRVGRRASPIAATPSASSPARGAGAGGAATTSSTATWWPASALLAWPAEYGDSGVMSFLVGNDGVVLEADLGPDTAERTPRITAYDPDPAWRRSTD